MNSTVAPGGTCQSQLRVNDDCHCPELPGAHGWGTRAEQRNATQRSDRRACCSLQASLRYPYGVGVLLMWCTTMRYPSGNTGVFLFPPLT